MSDYIDNDEPQWPWGFFNTEYKEGVEHNRAANTAESQGSAIRKWISEYLDVRLKLDEIKPEDVSKYINVLFFKNMTFSYMKYKIKIFMIWLTIESTFNYYRSINRG